MKYVKCVVESVGPAAMKNKIKNKKTGKEWASTIQSKIEDEFDNFFKTLDKKYNVSVDYDEPVLGTMSGMVKRNQLSYNITVTESKA